MVDVIHVSAQEIVHQLGHLRVSSLTVSSKIGRLFNGMKTCIALQALSETVFSLRLVHSRYGSLLLFLFVCLFYVLPDKYAFVERTPILLRRFPR